MASAPWLPRLGSVGEVEAVLAARQPHLRVMSRDMVVIEDAHSMAHLIGADSPEQCLRIGQVLDGLEAAIDRGVRALWN